MKKILAIDDDQAVLNYLNIMLLQTGAYAITPLVNSSRAFHELKSNNYDLLLLDMDMPDVSGLDILKHIKEKGIDIETIVLTGVEDVELAVSAMKLGAFDYLTKPVDNDQLLKVISTVLENRRERGATAAEATLSREQLQFKEAFQGIVSQNAEMIRIFQMVEKMAQPDNSILIWGESGTGKELIAKAIH
ncbi:MAG: response regulator, partial [Acidobacteriota bacterium]|nr:response regulator [Acidobacteriota bacterium]